MNTEDYIVNMPPGFLKDRLISKTHEELDNLYNSRDVSAGGY